MPQFIHFEDLNATTTQDFVAHAHQETLHHLDGALFQNLKNDITATLRDERQIPFCQEHQAKMYHFYQSAEFPKGVYRVCSAASYRAGIPDWQILFSVADFDGILSDDVYLDGVSHYVEQPNRVLLSLSVGGGDAAYTLEFDLNSGSLVEGGFHFPAAKSHIAWRDENSVWVCPAWDERQLTESGYPRQVWLMKRGQSFEEALPVLQIEPDGMMVNAWRYLDGLGSPIDLIEAAHGFFRKDYYQVDEEGTPHLLNLPENCEICGYLGGQLLVHLKSKWQRANQTYPAGSLVAVKINKGITGAAHLLFTPTTSQALESVETTKRFVAVSLLDNVSGKLKAWKYHQGQWQECILPNLPNGAIAFTDQPWGGDVLYLTADDFLTPLTLYALDLNVMELSVMRRQKSLFNSEKIEIVQHHATSCDGTLIPYYCVGKNIAADTPVLVYAYGGFAVAELPHYLGSIGKHWLSHGGAFVLANIRGGGEFVGWHEAAQKQNKHKSVDDLLAVVHDLHHRGFSSPQYTALQGGSNGGLITAAVFTREPQSIGALVCEVPLTDMLRYTQLSAGASWIDEYGDPSQSEEFLALHQLSPYHQLQNNTTYPPALITSNLSDDRVHPAHAIKFYAKLRHLGAKNSWLYANLQGGHTGNSTQEQTAEETAVVLSFLYKTIGSKLAIK